MNLKQHASTSALLRLSLLFSTALILAACGGGQPPATSESAPEEAEAPPAMADNNMEGKELPVRLIPNVPSNAEAYYAPDNLHVIAQTQDRDRRYKPRRSIAARRSSP